MGTRSLIVFLDFDEKKEIAVLYGQWDGEPALHGAALAEFLRDIKPTQGLVLDRKTANGIHCLAAQVIAHFKTEPGNFYLYSGGARNMNEEFIYVVTIQELIIRVLTQDDQGRELFKGDATQFFNWTEARKK